jgi:hypothetical protein
LPNVTIFFTDENFLFLKQKQKNYPNMNFSRLCNQIISAFRNESLLIEPSTLNELNIYAKQMAEQGTPVEIKAIINEAIKNEIKRRKIYTEILASSSGL